jgi:single-strand DNA-binding protein
MLVGNLTRDPETRMLASGQQMARLGIAVNRVYKDKEGKRCEEANFFNLVAFEKRAEALSRFARKGSLLFVDGRLGARTVQNDRGESRTFHDIVIEGFQFLSPASRGQEAGSPRGAAADLPGAGEEGND